MPTLQEATLTRIQLKDAAQGASLSHAVGWHHHDENSWSQAIQWSKGLAIGFRDKERLIASGFAIPYERKRARICMIITHPSYQKQGLATRIITHLLDHLSDFETIDLDASSSGQALYQKFGFRPLFPIRTWQFQGDAPKDPILKSPKVDVKTLIDIDHKAFGYKREDIIKQITNITPELAFSDDEGMALGTWSAGTLRIGPWIHPHPQGARRLMATILQEAENQKVRVVTPGPNPHAAPLLQNLGFVELDNPHKRMVRGEDTQESTNLYYAMISMVTG